MISVSLDIKATPATVWSCLTRQQHLLCWWGENVSLDASPGGKFKEVWIDRDGTEKVTTGDVKAIEAGKKLHISWTDEDWELPTDVVIRLDASPQGTRLTLEHTGWENFMGDLMDSLREDHEAGWRSHLYSLKSYAERLKE
ncbi:SRPBCC family protein [Luteithermobacter gelatinilyticus]|uniref:SRPBCC family protein n=1 Tax=Luteithermobacter gelatinilyticus TaxID=2582913 RepID=UPI00110753D0|nr:SRPBCC domain-containing protein [Luteithermobacter gelatinilyticus]|tara:strand:- start:3413 stop:3835 length:423 start_codon:yes stop_codon:yes gene_type:complete